MTTDQIISLVISTCPSLIAILTMIGVVIRVLKAFSELKKNVVDMKATEEVNDKLANVLHENYELKKKLNETMTMIDRIQRK